MSGIHNQELAPVYSEVRLVGGRDAYVLQQAALLAPGVTVRGYSAEGPEDVVWGAEQFVAGQGHMDLTERDRLTNRAIDFITAGGFAMQVMVDMTTEVGGTTPTAVLDAYFTQMQMQLN
jgi:hypothetical protein